MGTTGNTNIPIGMAEMAKDVEMPQHPQTAGTATEAHCAQRSETS